MADWTLEFSRLFLELVKNEPTLAKAIYLAIKRIEHNPSIGTYIHQTRRVYTDPDMQFRISYNSNSQSKEIELVVLTLLNTP